MNKTFLHAGCGLLNKENSTPEFSNDSWDEVRLDIDEKVKPDIVASLTDMSPVESNSFDAVYSSHNIEHLFAHEVPTALNEMYRVLKNDGFLIITCPDLQEVCKHIAEGRLLDPLYQSGMGPISPLDILYGHRDSIQKGNVYMAHKVGFTDKVLYATITSSKFKSVLLFRQKSSYNLWAIAYKDVKISKDDLMSSLSKHVK